MHVTSVGIDLGKTTFHLVALDDHGKVVIKKKFSRRQLLSARHKASSKSRSLQKRQCDEQNSGRGAKRNPTRVRFHGCTPWVAALFPVPYIRPK
jgi:transposase